MRAMSYHAARANVDHLHQRPRFGAVETDHVLIRFTRIVDDRLSLQNQLNIFDCVANFRGGLKALISRRIFHFFTEIAQYRFVFTP